jgi:hypothetical protein
MKTTLITILAILGTAVNVFAQGAISLSNVACNGGIVVNGTSGSSLSGFGYLTGVGGLEVWFLNGTSFNVAAINQHNVGGGDPATAYAALSANSFTLATHVSTVAGGINVGSFALGYLDMATVSPAGSKVTLAIAAWDGSGGSFSGADHSGVLAFAMQTVDYTRIPMPTPADFHDGVASTDGFNANDLVLNPQTQVPEPSTFALAGLAAAALLILRCRKRGAAI